MRKKDPHHTAAIETYEEAGLIGVIEKRPVGNFKHRKRKGERKRTMNVAVFPIKVHRQERYAIMRALADRDMRVPKPNAIIQRDLSGRKPSLAVLYNQAA